MCCVKVWLVSCVKLHVCTTCRNDHSTILTYAIPLSPLISPCLPEVAFKIDVAGSIANIITKLDLVPSIQLNTGNPFSFAITPIKLSIKLGYDDSDGVPNGYVSSYYPPKIKDASAATVTQRQFGNLLVAEIKTNLADFTLQPLQQKLTPKLEIPVASPKWENVERFLDEYFDKSRFCLHALYGLADIRLDSPVKTDTPYTFSLPFSIAGASMAGDYDCDYTMDCSPFDAGMNYETVFDYTNLASSIGNFKTNSDVGTGGDYMRVTKEKGTKGSAFTTATYNVLDSWEVSFEYEVKEGDTPWWSPNLGHADGFFLVLTDGPSNQVGDKGDWGQGYKNLAGHSIGIGFDTYGGVAGSRNAGIFFNASPSKNKPSTRGANVDDLCNTLSSSNFPGNTQTSLACDNGYLIKTDFKSGHDIASGRHQVRVVYDGVRHQMFVHMFGIQILQGHINMPQVFGEANARSNVRIGFTASTGDGYVSEHRFYNLRFRRALADASRSKLVENGRTVGALFDEKSKPFKLTLDLKDACGHDRSIHERSPSVVSVRLISVDYPSLAPIQVPTNCPASLKDVGTCPIWTDNPTATFQPKVGGLYQARFLATKEGTYNVEVSVNGKTNVVGEVYIAN